MAGRKDARRGFTIIEIMVAVMLLATSLVAIFGAQFAAVASTSYARNITQATELARCRMSALELLFQEEGFQEGNVDESGACCEFIEGETFTEFTCDWKIETVQFPDMSTMMGGDEEGEGGASDLAQSIIGGASGEDGAGLTGLATDGMAEMGLGMVSELMPAVTSLLEQAIRKVTVTVRWKEGVVEKDFEIIQYVTHPSQGPLGLMQEAGAMEDLMNQMMPGGAGGGNAGGSSPSNIPGARLFPGLQKGER